MEGETSDDGFESDKEASKNRGARRKESFVESAHVLTINQNKMMNFEKQFKQRKELEKASGENPEFLEGNATELARSKLFAIGREVADCIEKSHTLLKYFIFSYDKWIQIRKKRIQLFLDKEKEIRKLYSSSAGDEIRSTIAAGADWRNVLVTNVMGFIFKFKQDQSKRENDIQHIYCQIITEYKKDSESISRVYSQGLQCCSQFQETRKRIEKFRDLIKKQEDLETIIKDGDVLEFLKEISYLNPVDLNFFYRRLRFCYETLLKNLGKSKNSKSDESKNFVRIFEYAPEAVQVINLLPWKFDIEGIDVKSVEAVQDKLFYYLQNVDEMNADTCSKRVFDCVQNLGKELGFLESIRNDLELLRKH